MNPIEFIFELLKNFVPIQSSKIAGLQKDGEDWYKANVEQAENPKGILKPVKQYANEWYIQLALATLYVFAFRWMNNFMNGSPEEDYQRR